jgi:hypothetical protein
MGSEDIQNKFKTRGIGRGGALFLRADGALELITEVDNSNLPIFGIECFVLTSEEAKPLPGQMLDLWNGEAGDTWVTAKERLNSRDDKGFYFEVVVGDA